MATLWDLIPKDREGKVWFEVEDPSLRPQTPAGASGAMPRRRIYFDRSSLTPELAAWADRPVPPKLAANPRLGSAAAQKIADRLGQSSAQHWNEAVGAANATQRAIAEREAAERPGGVGWQALAGATEPLTNFPGAPARKERLRFLEEVGPPRNIGEHVARFVGGVGGFVGQAAAYTAATAPVLGPFAPAAGLFLTGAGQEAKSFKERMIRGGTLMAAGAAGELAGSAIAGGVLRAGTREAATLARAEQIGANVARAAEVGGAPATVARAAGERAAATEIARATEATSRLLTKTHLAAGTGTGAVVFGAVQPWAENYWRRKTGETDLPPITFKDMAKASAELGLFNVVTAGLGPGAGLARRGVAEAGAAARRGLAAARPEVGPSLPPSATPVPPTRVVEPIPGMGGPHPPPAATGPGGLPYGSLPGRGERIVSRFERPLRGPKNPLFGGASQIETFRARFRANLAALPEAGRDEHGVARAAAQAAGYAKKAEAIRAEMIQPVPTELASQHAFSTKRTDEMLVGKQINVTLPEFGEAPVSAKVVKTFWYPWDKEAGFKVLLEDPASGDLVPASYPNPEAFAGALVRQQAERGPAGTIPGIFEEQPGGAPSAAVAPRTSAAPSREPAPEQTPPPVAPSEQAPAPTPPPPKPAPSTLPRDLAGAKPRYSYGSKQFELAFASDNDRAAYIAAQETKSKRDADYRAHLTAQGWTDAEINAHGKRVRAAVKEMARVGNPDEGSLKVPETPRDIGGVGKADVAHPPHIDFALARAVEQTGAAPKLAEMVKTGASDAEIEQVLADHFKDGGGDSGIGMEYGQGGVRLTRTPEGLVGPTKITLIEAAKRLRASLGIPTRAAAQESAGQGSLFGGEALKPAEQAATETPAAPEAEESIEQKHVRQSAAVIEAVKSGKPFTLHTQTRATRYSDPADLKLNKDGHLMVRRSGSKEFDYLFFNQVEAIAHQLGIEAAPVPSLTEHLANIDREAAARNKSRAEATGAAAGEGVAKDSALEGFLSSIGDPKQATRARDALAVNMTSGGVLKSRQQIVEEMVGAGATVVEHPKDRRRLQRPTGEFIEESRLTKTAMDYAEHLIAERAPEGAAKSRLDEVNARLLELEDERDAIIGVTDSSRGTKKEPRLNAAERARVEAIDKEAARLNVEADALEKGAALPAAEAPPPTDRRIVRIPEGVRVGDVGIMPEKFQQRLDVDQRGVVQEKIQRMLRESGGKLNEDALEAAPIVVWRDKNNVMGEGEGKLFVIDGHHRLYVATNKFELQDDGRYVATGKIDRSVPAVEFKGDWEQAVQYAKDANRKVTPPTFVEDVARAVELSRAKQPIEKIADKLQVTKGKAKKMVEFGNLAPDVQIALANENVRDYGAALGRAVERHPNYYVADVQRQYQQRILGTPRQYHSVTHLEDMLRLNNVVLETWDPTDLFNMPTPAELERAWHRASGRITSGVRDLTSRIRAAEKFGKKEGADARILAEQRLSIVRPKLELYAKIQKQFSLEKIAQRLSTAHKEQRMEAEIDKIKAEIDALLGPPTAEDYDKGGPFMLPPHMLGFGSMHWDMIANQRAAIRQALDRMGRKFTQFRLQRDGQTVHSEPAFLSEPDYWHEYALYRFVNHFPGLRNLGITGGDVLPVRFERVNKQGKPETVAFRHEWMTADAKITHLVRREEELTSMLFGDEALQLLQPYSREDLLFGQAMNGDKSALDRLPPVLQRAVKPMSDLWHHELDVAIEALKQRNKPVPGRIREYLPWLVDVLLPERLHENLKEIEGEGLRDADLVDRKNRFYLQREGYEPEFKSFVEARRRWLNAWARKMVLDPLIETTGDYLRSQQARGEEVRASQVRSWVQAHWMKRKGKLESDSDQSLRKFIFAQARGTVQEVTDADLVAWFGSTGAQHLVNKAFETLGEKPDRFVAVLKGKDRGVKFTSPKKWIKVGETSQMDVYAGSKGIAFGTPKLHAPLEFLHEALTENPIWFTKMHERADIRRWFSEPERVKRMLQRRNALLRLENNPTNAATAGWTKGTTRMAMGWNLGGSFVNALNAMVTTIPEHGLGLSLKHRPEGVIGAAGITGHIAARKAARGIISGAAKLGLLTPEQAEHYRKHIPYLAHELMLDAISLRQGEAFYLQRMAEKLSDKRTKAEVAVAELMRPMAWYQIVESLTRGFDMHAAYLDAQRRGYKMGDVVDRYELSDAGRFAAQDAMMRALADPQSALAEVMRSSNRTMYNYGAMGQPNYMESPAGQMLGSLSTWSINTLMKYLARPLEATARTTVLRPFLRPSAEHVQGTKVFIRSLAVAGFLLYLADRTKKNWAVAGVSSAAITLLKVLDSVLPFDEKTKKEWIARALKGETTPIVGTLTGEFGRTQYRRLPFASPTLSILSDWRPGGTGRMFMDILRSQLPGLTQWRRIVSGTPEAFGPGAQLHWVAEALGVRQFYRYDKGQFIKAQFRLMDPTEQQHLKIATPRKPKKGKGAAVGAY